MLNAARLQQPHQRFLDRAELREHDMPFDLCGHLPWRIGSLARLHPRQKKELDKRKGQEHQEENGARHQYEDRKEPARI